MAFGIKLIQNGVVLADGSQVHPAPINVTVNVLCYLSFTGTSTSYLWTLSSPTGSHSVISSATSAAPTVDPDINAGAYSITLVDSSGNVYVLDIQTATSIVSATSAVDIYVASYGALGDGSTNDAAAIQSAFTAGAGRNIHFSPNKTYVYKSETPLVPAANTCIYLHGSTVSFPTMSWVGDRNILIDIDGVNNVKVLGPGKLQLNEDHHTVSTDEIPRVAYAIQINNANGTTVQSVEMSQCGWDGVIVSGTSTGTVLRDCYIHNVRRSLVSVTGGTSGTIENLRGDHTGDGDSPQEPRAGIDFESESGGTIAGWTVINPQFSSIEQGIIIQKGSGGVRPTDIAIVGGVIDTPTETGVNCVSADRIHILGITVKNCNGAIIQGSSKFGAAFTDCSECHVFQNNFANCSRGVTVIASDGVVIEGNTGTGTIASLNHQSYAYTGSNNLFIAVGHGFTNTQQVNPTNIGGAPPPGITAGTNVFIIFVDVDHFKLASTLANALSGTPIAIGGAGSGTNVLTVAGQDYDAIEVTHRNAVGSPGVPVRAVCSNVVVKGNYFYDFAGASLLLSAVNGVEVVANNFHNCGRNSIEAAAVIAGTIKGNTSTGHGREFTSGAFANIDVKAGCDYLNIEGNKLKKHLNFLSGTCQATTNADQITLDAAASANWVDDQLINAPIQITGGTGAGGESLITNYNHTTKVASVNHIATTAPTAGSLYEIRYKNIGTASINVEAASTGVRLINNDIGEDFAISDAGTGTVVEWVPATGSKTWDPPSVNSGAETTTTVTVTGAALGDEADASFSLSLAGMKMTAYVSTSNTVTVVLRNDTGSPVDLSSGTLRAIARRIAA